MDVTTIQFTRDQTSFREILSLTRSFWLSEFLIRIHTGRSNSQPEPHAHYPSATQPGFGNWRGIANKSLDSTNCIVKTSTRSCGGCLSAHARQLWSHGTIVSELPRLYKPEVVDRTPEVVGSRLQAGRRTLWAHFRPGSLDIGNN